MKSAAKTLGGKVVVVTGSTGGIGQAVCDTLADCGCRLGLLGRNAEKLQSQAARLRERGVEAAWQLADMRDRAAVQAAVAALLAELGTVDVLVHNAGVGRLTRAASPNLDDLQEMIEINYLAGAWAIEAVLPSMLARGSGQLAVVSSLSARCGMPSSAGYSASKAAISIFLESLRPVLRRRGIATTTCYVGFVRTPMTEALPLRAKLRMMSPAAAARRIVRAIVRRRREAYFPWYDACAVALARHLPAWAFDAVMSRVGPRILSGDD